MTRSITPRKHDEIAENLTQDILVGQYRTGARLPPLLEGRADRQANSIARFELMQAIMQASGNLVCQISARSLFLQFVPRMAPLEDYVELDLDAQRSFALRLDAALAARNVAAVRSTFESLSNFNREVARRAFAAIKAHSGSGATACAFSTGSGPGSSTPGRHPGIEENSA